jgi:hypothetical protein
MTETGSVMIDVLRMEMDRPAAGIDLQRHCGANGEMRA